ncbi:MFS transporter [Mucilaginibacter terrae]|uniref:MFS family arabinose efflux permease n=1 Tax=Mucilaginibacter terrae TaxID=1955052 RepID=A0ABU3GTM1_9SPHI|nr:MFS transporter [Mucilaginibacter terrae]MDT3403000.1 putative MFS family arabinose efflux permease [Mucilaginibacter terrae]
MSITAHQHKLTPLILWTMTLATGFVVANIYYNQPLLGDIAHDFKISNGQAGQISMFTQIGYATGLLLIVPLADMFKRKRLMLIDLACVFAALMLVATAKSLWVMALGSFLLGVTSIIPQILLPMAAHLANPEERGKKIGFIMSGLLIGILLSRTVSGIVGEHLGWRSMFYIAAALMLLMWMLIALIIPEVEPQHKGNYGSLMRSLITLIKEEPKLRIAALRGALCFACFSAFWTTLVFLLREPPFNEGSAVAGAFGLIGAFGALAASLIGRLSDKSNPDRLITYTLLLLLVSFIIFFAFSHSMAGLIVGVILMDMGVQATHISNQSIIFGLNPSARNRINTVYMVSYFAGGSAGTFLASRVWGTFHWPGVCVIGITLSVIVLLVHLLNSKKSTV